MISLQPSSSPRTELMARCSLAASNLCFSSAQFLWIYAESFLTCFTILPASIFGLVVTCFFVSLPLTHIFPSGGFLLSNSNRVTPIHCSDSGQSPSTFQKSSMFLCLSLDVIVIQKCREIVLRNISFDLGAT